MTSPLMQSGEEIFDRLILRPEVAMEQTYVGNRALLLLGDKFVQRWLGFEIMARIVREHGA